MTHFTKIKISADIELKTGLHIGSSDAFSAIGAVDSVVIKDPLTNKPIIPGSSIKGKMRSLLAQSINEEIAPSPNQDHKKIRRLFGDSTDYKQGRLIFRDAFLENAEEMLAAGAKSLTEVKYENTINRIDAQASPRQLERVIVGSEFAFELIYTITADMDSAEIDEDLNTIKQALELLELDYLGGSGTRGYGQIAFANLTAEPVFGEEDQDVINSLQIFNQE